MKNQYVGDIRDFEKYAVLRALAAAAKLPVGVCWLLTPADRTRDGGRIDYLDDPATYRRLDPYVFDRLSALVTSGNRTVVAIREAQIIPDATYYEALVERDLGARRMYLDGFWSELPTTPSIVFFDPDNSLATVNMEKKRSRSPKHIYLDEVADAYGRGHSVVVFHHWARYKKEPFLDELGQRFKRQSQTAPAEPFVVYNSGVAFIVLTQPEHDTALRESARLVADQSPELKLIFR